MPPPRLARRTAFTSSVLCAHYTTPDLQGEALCLRSDMLSAAGTYSSLSVAWDLKRYPARSRLVNTVERDAWTEASGAVMAVIPSDALRWDSGRGSLRYSLWRRIRTGRALNPGGFGYEGANTTEVGGTDTTRKFRAPCRGVLMWARGQGDIHLWRATRNRAGRTISPAKQVNPDPQQPQPVSGVSEEASDGDGEQVSRVRHPGNQGVAATSAGYQYIVCHVSGKSLHQFWARPGRPQTQGRAWRLNWAVARRVA